MEGEQPPKFHPLFVQISSPGHGYLLFWQSFALYNGSEEVSHLSLWDANTGSDSGRSRHPGDLHLLSLNHLRHPRRHQLGMRSYRSMRWTKNLPENSTTGKKKKKNTSQSPTT